MWLSGCKVTNFYGITQINLIKKHSELHRPPPLVQYLEVKKGCFDTFTRQSVLFLTDNNYVNIQISRG